MRRRLLLILIAAVPHRRRRGQPGSGVRSMVQVVPFQRSASVRAPLAEEPTATQTVGDGQDTPVNRLAWVGLGAGMIRHRDPFHRSASAVSREAGDGMAVAPRLSCATATPDRGAEQY